MEHRSQRMVRLCENSAVAVVAVELALKALDVLHDLSVPSEDALRWAGHDIDRRLDLLPELPLAPLRLSWEISASSFARCRSRLWSAGGNSRGWWR